MLCAVALAWLASRLLERISALQLDMGVFLLGLECFLALVLACVLIYLSWCVFSIRYLLDDKQLVIRRGGVRYEVPLESITEVYEPGDAVGSKSVAVRWRGVPPFIPGYVVGSGESAQLGKVVSAATTSIRHQTFVCTSSVAFGLSPNDPAEFITQLEKARDAASGLLESEESPPLARLSGPNAWGARIWSDKFTRRLLVAGLVVNVLFFGYLSLVYGNLPTHLPLHWNAQAQIDRIGDPVELLRLPIFAAGVWLFSVVAAAWTMRKERAVSLFLLGGALAAQVVFWAGALSIVLRTPG